MYTKNDNTVQKKMSIIWYCTWSSHYDSCKLVPNRKAILHFKLKTKRTTHTPQTHRTGWKQLGL